MSIKGIDTQIMVARTAEMSRDSSVQNRRGELSQNQLAVQNQAQDAQDTHRVGRTEEADQVEIRRDKEREESGERRRRRDRRRGDRREPAKGSDGQLSAGFGGEHKIDIKV